MGETQAYRALGKATQLQPPCVALILGSGQGEIADRVQHDETVPYREVPGLEPTSVVGHRGSLVLGRWGGKRLLVFQGRLHLYEGCPGRSVSQPAWIARELGARILLATNSAGGIHPALEPPCLLALAEHIDWTRPFPWREAGPGGLAAQRPSPYSHRLWTLLQQAARDRHIELARGSYAQVTGPCYETPAEIRALKAWGADVVGMSTAVEIAAGHGLGLECAALSCVTNRAAGLGQGPILHQEVLANAAALLKPLGDVLERFLEIL